MPAPWLIFDVNNVANRYYYAMRNSQRYPAIYGVLKQIVDLTGRFETERVVFAFDGPGENKRKSIYPDYKKKPPADAKKILERADITNQICELRDVILPKLGYRNIFFQDGYEADDVIASVTQTYLVRFVIVSNDQDLYQLLRGAPYSVRIWNFKNTITRTGFEAIYGIWPKRWHEIKALAGCVRQHTGRSWGRRKDRHQMAPRKPVGGSFDRSRY